MRIAGRPRRKHPRSASQEKAKQRKHPSQLPGKQRSRRGNHRRGSSRDQNRLGQRIRPDRHDLRDHHGRHGLCDPRVHLTRGRIREKDHGHPDRRVRQGRRDRRGHPDRQDLRGRAIHHGHQKRSVPQNPGELRRSFFGVNFACQLTGCQCLRCRSVWKR